MAQDATQSLQAAVQAALAERTPLNIIGSGSKAFYGRRPDGKPLPVSSHRGILNYEPKELVISARAGTPLRELEQALAEQGQMLPFEPPHFGEGATLGGAVACGLSGPRRPYTGSVRDFVLGCRLISGKGEALRFGGEVMKNVAGYDVSRLMVGAMGTLGVILDLSLKVLPRPAVELTLVQERTPADAITAMNAWAGKTVPLSAAVYDGNRLTVRLAGAKSAVKAAQQRVGGTVVENAAAFWERIREQRHAFFDGAAPLWRLSLPPATAPLDVPGKWLLDWGGAQRWLRSDADAETIRRAAGSAGGHATLFRGGERNDVFHPLPAALLGLHRALKRSLDPSGIFNPGRLYAGL